MPERIPAESGLSDGIRISAGALSHAGEWAARLLGPGTAFVVTDANVKRLYLPALRRSLTDAGFAVSALALPAGERAKTPRALLRVLNAMARARLTRSDVVVALGGGVVGDVAGLAAALYLRGVPLVSLPTTLLAQVDSAYGGKTAVNLPAGKNLMGAFAEPKLVACDPALLQTLPPREVRCGLAEAIKTAMMLDGALLPSLQAALQDPAGPLSWVAEHLPRLVECKLRLTRADPFDRGDRRMLNYGHTLGHAVEHAYGGRLSHGHCVALGMLCVTRKTERLGLSEPGTFALLQRTLRLAGLPDEPPRLSAPLRARARRFLAMDKKQEGTRLTVAYPRRAGEGALLTTDGSFFEEWLR